ncbi:MAG: hypothetical protein HQL51_01620 [Magnetococcales bacterium]|nr:hypothetical protein [Magnetococcales bacterium]
MEDAALEDITRMSDLKPEEIGDLTPSTLEGVLAVCKEINPHFFRLRGRLTALARLPPPEA